MKNKTTTSNPNAQHLIAGLLQKDNNIEFFGIPGTMKVQWIQNGHGHQFEELSKLNFSLLATAYHSNKTAMEHLSTRVENGQFISFARQVEIYTYFMYGGLDVHPDIVEGELQEYENYRHTRDCVSLNFKQIHLNGSPLKPREIKMIDLMGDGEKHDVIAEELGITVSTYNQHKKELFTKTGTYTSTGLMLDAFKAGIVQDFNEEAL